MTETEFSQEIERVRRLAALITYKPGWSFSVDPSEHFRNRELGIFKITLTMNVQDTVCVGTWKSLYFWKFCDTYVTRTMPDGALIENVFVRQIREAEEHEMKEWFRVEGFRVYNPHPENGDEILYESRSGFDSQLHRSDQALC